MNRAWKILIATGIISLVAVIGWEFFQISTGGRTTFNLSVLPMERGNLFSQGVENKLRNDPGFLNPSLPVSNPVNSLN